MIPFIKKYIADRPSLTFRCAHSLNDKLTHSHYTAPVSTVANPPRGTFSCGSCNYCYWISNTKDFVLPNGEQFHPQKCINCRTTVVIYLMRCKCNAFYLAKTKRQFQRRVHDHIYAISNGKIDTPIANYVGLQHNFDLSVLHFVSL